MHARLCSRGGARGRTSCRRRRCTPPRARGSAPVRSRRPPSRRTPAWRGPPPGPRRRPAPKASYSSPRSRDFCARPYTLRKFIAPASPPPRVPADSGGSLGHRGVHAPPLGPAATPGGRPPPTARLPSLPAPRCSASSPPTRGPGRAPGGPGRARRPPSGRRRSGAAGTAPPGPAGAPRGARGPGGGRAGAGRGATRGGRPGFLWGARGTWPQDAISGVSAERGPACDCYSPAVPDRFRPQGASLPLPSEKPDPPPQTSTRDTPPAVCRGHPPRAAPASGARAHAYACAGPDAGEGSSAGAARV